MNNLSRPPNGFKVIPVCIAEPLLNTPTPCIIQCTHKLPDFGPMGGTDLLAAHRAYYDTEAKMIADGLFDALPQGTLDRILIHFMQRKLSLYRGLTNT